MEETRKFLRYVTPGVVFVLEAAILLYILLPWWIPSLLISLKTDGGLGLALAAVLATGAFGFLLSVIHHNLHWCFHCLRIDYGPLIHALLKKDTISISDIYSNQTYDKDSKDFIISPHDSYVILSAMWFERLGDNTKIDKSEARICALTDLVHSTGTAMVSTICAYVVTLCIAGIVADLSFERPAVFRFLGMSLVGLMLFGLHLANHRRTTRICQHMVEQIFVDALEEEKKKAMCQCIKTNASLDKNSSKTQLFFRKQLRFLSKLANQWRRKKPIAPCE
ncbi:MAG: hypothetical protein JXA73_10830 [Acidobacteria bacterium]|nr:hypothetical protein [Acidobacteriota bacterium]